MSGFRVYTEQNPVLHTTLGDIELMLRPDEAPNTAWNFRHLVEAGFYTNVSFHRIVARTGNGHPFVIQGGDPSATGSGGCAYNIDLEDTTLPHDLGVISMAREGQDVNTASSQFFICLSREGTQALDGQYASFGQTIDGIDVVQALGDVPVGPGDRPIDMPYVTTAELIDAAPRVPGTRPTWMPEPVEQPTEKEPEPEKEVDPGR
ncbi:MAG: peptidylprolyl isomerase [Planctomycetes bacterium]|nr:peptidylprolyl isomerase [Planctomycetota bacterium]NOG54056.1 peptidylprolyl isomerase [Planctomycetota bacterium]